jgi:hypothetical protein
MFVPGRPFEPIITFVRKARSITKCGSLEICSTWVGSDFTPKHLSRLKRPAKDKHFSLLNPFENYSCTNVYDFGLRRAYKDMM